jgi:hypothetical protein
MGLLLGGDPIAATAVILPNPEEPPKLRSDAAKGMMTGSGLARSASEGKPVNIPRWRVGLLWVLRMKKLVLVSLLVGLALMLLSAIWPLLTPPPAVDTPNSARQPAQEVRRLAGYADERANPESADAAEKRYAATAAELSHVRSIRSGVPIALRWIGGLLALTGVVGHFFLRRGPS